MTRRFKSAIELVSDIGAKGFDLQHHSESDIAEAVTFLRHVNGPMFDWLVRVLSDAGGRNQPVADSADLMAPRTVNGEARDKVCMHGHRQLQIGCVSCALLHQRHDGVGHE